ncbi:MAG: SDR family oxidoreductase [Ignisphaera sp.]|nr:SDR family oxidoreductase [Ignisphaera sp.]
MVCCKRFKDRVCVVTGGARGIGAAIAYRLGLEGCGVAIIDIDGEAAKYRFENLEKNGIEATYVKADVSAEDEVTKAMEGIHSRYGSIDVLINNAGIGFSGRELENQSYDEWRRVIDVNLTGVWLCSKYAVKYMKRSGGVIVNIASTRALQSEPNTEPYSASKGGLVALTHAMAISLAKYRIRVVSVSPGWIDTSEWQVPPRRPSLTLLDNLWHPAGRVGRPEDIAAIVAFLASDEAEWITGINIVVDGGVTSKMVYMDESLIFASLEVLLQDEELVELIKTIVERSREEGASVKNRLRSIFGIGNG